MIIDLFLYPPALPLDTEEILRFYIHMIAVYPKAYRTHRAGVYREYLPVLFYSEPELSVEKYADRVVVPRARKHDGVARGMIDRLFAPIFPLYQFIVFTKFSREGSPEPPLRIL